MFREFEYVLDEDVDADEMRVISIDLNGRHCGPEEFQHRNKEKFARMHGLDEVRWVIETRTMIDDCRTPIRVF